MATNVGSIAFSIEIDNQNQIRSVIQQTLNGAQQTVNRQASTMNRQLTNQANRTANNVVAASNRAGRGMINSMSNATGTMTSMLKSFAKTAFALFSIRKIIDFGASSVKLASDLQEVQNVVDVTFGNLNSKVDEFAKSAITTIGLSETVAKKYMGTFGAMAKAFGLSNDEAYNMSKELTKLSGDVASFYNMTSDEAQTKLKSIFTGETESLKQLGVVMTQTALDAYALENGFGKTTRQMSEQEKVMLRYQFVMSKLSLAQGDFMRTQDGWANQTRVLKLQFDSLKAAIGEGLIAVLTPVVKMLNLIISKLTVAAQAFSGFMKALFGVKESSSGSAQLAQDIAMAGSSAENLADGTGETAKNLKKAAKSLMGFDKLYRLNDNSSDASTSSGLASNQGGFSIDNLTPENNTAKEVEKLNGAFEKLFNTFKAGFSSVFNPDDFKQVINNIGKIKTELKSIFTDPSVKNAAYKMMNQFAYALGQSVGAIASVGTTIAKLLTGSIAKYLESNRNFLIDKISSIFSNVGDLSAKMGNFSAAIADIFSVFGSDTAQQIGSNILGMIVNPVITLIDTLIKLKTDVFDVITGPIVDNVDKIKSAIQGILDAYLPVFESIKGTIDVLCGAITTLYDNHIRPFFQSVRDGLSEILGTFLDAWNTYINPVLEALGKKVADVFNTSIKPTILKVGEVIGKLIDLIRVLWEQVLQPLINWIVKNILPIIAPIMKTVGTMVWNTVGTISNAIGGLLTSLGGVLDFLLGVFTGDWSRAWNGIKSIFKGVWDSLAAIAKGPINMIIDMINWMTSKISRALTIRVPNWIPEIGGRSWGISIPSIPRLAEGGYVKPNNPQLAIIGDNKRQGEIVAPESKITDAVNKALIPLINQLAMALRGPQTAMAGGDIVIPVYIGNEKIEDYIVNVNKKNTFRSGR